jgi:hypothetical protein
VVILHMGDPGDGIDERHRPVIVGESVPALDGIADAHPAREPFEMGLDIGVLHRRLALERLTAAGGQFGG